MAPKLKSPVRLLLLAVVLELSAQGSTDREVKPERGIKEEAWRQRREWEEFEVLDARMKKFPLKLLVDWAAAATGLEVAQGQFERFGGALWARGVELEHIQLTDQKKSETSC
ncbi:hypothetical protein D4764_15G0003580 [Takifugu flavidus]|uniref:Uncharacterized protein n=1 Tax=Takifugu flavidus TaxID=433684 RepID=A0A5C6NZK2_9TELE|nr:hypothetical protein D4764_15G0003580 [Takifugu flavidus]